MFPYNMRDGARLALADRIVRPDWNGMGLAAHATWQDIDEAPASIVMTCKEQYAMLKPAADSSAPASLSLRLSIGSLSIGSVPGSGIPTVASTISPGPSDGSVACEAFQAYRTARTQWELQMRELNQALDDYSGVLLDSGTAFSDLEKRLAASL
ncbi:MAG: hypothetical protein JST33_03975 [Actinobacteria bacterium]|nr:hypothetical protein [Actinomycetota bacterium]